MIDPYSKYITTYLREHLEKKEQQKKIKDSFWPSENEALLFDVYHRWIGTEPTNPMEPEKLVMFTAAKMIELAFVESLVEMELAKKIDGQEHFRIDRGIPVSGYYDAILIDGTPLEFKTIYGPYASQELKTGNPRKSYLKQLAIYMDSLGKDKGKLVYMDRGTGETFEFTLNRLTDSRFKCMGIEFDLKDTYSRWRELYINHIEKRIEPPPDEAGLYKADINSIDWSKISNSDISKARNGHKVIGSDTENHWKILYSPYKDLIIERQKSTPGYSDAELNYIKTLTKNYSKR